MLLQAVCYGEVTLWTPDSLIAVCCPEIALFQLFVYLGNNSKSTLKGTLNICCAYHTFARPSVLRTQDPQAWSLFVVSWHHLLCVQRMQLVPKKK